MTTAKDIEDELISQGYDVDGVVSTNPKQTFYAVGFPASDLPDSVLGYATQDDPTLVS